MLSALQLVLGAAALAVYLGPEWALVIAALLAILEVATTRPTMW